MAGGERKTWGEILKGGKGESILVMEKGKREKANLERSNKA